MADKHRIFTHAASLARASQKHTRTHNAHMRAIAPAPVASAHQRALTSRAHHRAAVMLPPGHRPRASRRAPARVAAHHGPMTPLMFTPDNALAGGLILGSMTIAKKLNTGTNLGISGETKAAMRGEAKASTAAFLLGLCAAGYVAPMILGAQAATPMVEAPRAIIAGALVGLGTSGAFRRRVSSSRAFAYFARADSRVGKDID